MLEVILPILFGVIVGFSLGLTGGGGSLFAVPLLVYGLAIAPRQAIGVSLVAVGSMAAVGALDRIRRGEVEFGAGLIFSIGGIAGAPLGAWAGRRAPEMLLMTGFGVLMVLVALRMWWMATANKAQASAVRVSFAAIPAERGAACQRDPEGKLRITSRCAMVMMIVGLVAGMLSGLFGVGGGFIIVPGLIMYTGMGIHRAVATSLMVIVLVSATGVAANWWAGMQLPMDLTLLFVAGGVAGLFLGASVCRRLSPVVMQKLFATAIVLLGIGIVVKSLLK